MRISCLRRRACWVRGITVLLAIVVRIVGFEPAARRSVEVLAMPRAQRAVAMQEQRRHAHELLDLGERLLVLLVAVVLRRGGGEPGDVGQRLAAFVRQRRVLAGGQRSEEHTSELQSLMRTSSAVFCLKKKTQAH